MTTAEQAWQCAAGSLRTLGGEPVFRPSGQRTFFEKFSFPWFRCDLCIPSGMMVKEASSRAVAGPVRQFSAARLGRSLLRNNVSGRALEYFCRAIEARPGSPEACFGAALACRKLGRIKEAISYCQRALACIDDFLGASDWFRAYLADGSPAPACGAEFPAAIYQTLAACHVAAGCPQNAWLCARAACDLVPGDKQAALLMASLEKTASGGKGRLQDAGAQELCPGKIPSLTVLVTTHFSDKLKINRHLAPPGTGLVQETWSSMVRVFGAGLARARRIVCLDGFDPADGRKLAYRGNLEKFCRANGFELFCPPTSGLLPALAAAVETISSDWFMLVEHDWRFVGQELDMAGLLARLESLSQVNYLRFNKRANLIRRFDFLMEVADDISCLPLLRTTAYSNNPCLIRTRVFRSSWLPLCLGDPLASAGGAGSIGVEEPLFKRLRRDVGRLGFAGAHRAWGTYVYGRPGDPARIVHLGV